MENSRQECGDQLSWAEHVQAFIDSQMSNSKSPSLILQGNCLDGEKHSNIGEKLGERSHDGADQWTTSCSYRGF